MTTTALKYGAILACAATLAFTADLRAQTHYEAVHTFSGNRGRPHAALAQGADGRLYGTTISGGFYGKGSVYATDGGGTLATIHEFDGSDGEAPRGRLLLGSDDALYGTTSGGTGGLGTIFRIAADGTFTTLVHFDGANGSRPAGALVEASDGSFYGTTLNGGATGNGTIFRITASGTLTTIVSFLGPDGAFPSGTLVEADGFLYGTTQEGGAANQGTVFRVSLDGTLETLVSFDGANGAQPADGPMLASDGSFYGATPIGGDFANCENGCGTIFKITGGVLETIHAFSNGDGKFPNGDLREIGGQIYGTTLDGGAGAGTVFSLALDGTFTSVASLSFEAGMFPRSAVMQAENGAIFGTTESGGPGTYGTVYELMPDGSIRTALAFTGTAGADPSSSLLQASDGNFYGTTTTGGDFGFGTVFRMTPEGVVTTIASFNGADTGSSPLSTGLVQASDGDLYGTTESGGATLDGTVFRVSPVTGVLTSMSMDFFVSGAVPSGRLIEGSDGRLYGTALFHADGDSAVFAVDRAAGTIEAAGILPADGSAGSFPSAGVVEAPDGSFYGTAEMGGASGFGAIFKLSGGAISPVFSFSDVDGSMPASPLLLASDGSLYGTTAMGGDTGDGTLFRLSLADDSLTSLASFDFTNGSFPYQQGVAESNGAIYGSALSGGASGVGVVYRWTDDDGLSVVHDFDGASGDGPNTTVIAAADGSLYGTAMAPQGGVIYRITFEQAAAATLVVSPASATYGGSTTLSATLTVSGAPLAGAEIAFSLNGVPVGSGITGADGAASLAGISVVGLNAGSYAGAVSAAFAGNDGVPAASAQGDLTIAQAVAVIAITDASYVYDALPHAASASVTGVGGEALGPVTFTYNGSATAPSEPGVYAVLASYAGNMNYQPASATATITITPAPAGLTGLVAAYAFEEGSGRIAGDASGNGNAGRIKRPQWVASGRFGGALDFDGVNDWVTVADAAALDMQTAITIEAWVKPRALSGWNTIVLKEGDARMAYALYANDSAPRPAGYVRVNFVDQAAVGRNPLALNAWSHVAMTYSGSTVRLYINGVEAGRRSVSGKIQASTGALRIGGNSIWGEFFNGVIDEVRIYKRELAAAEIVRDMNTPIAHEGVAPSVAITSPADGAVLSGLPTVSVSAADNFVLSNVRLQVDGADIDQAAGSDPMTFALDVANGAHVLTAVAQDAAGNMTTSAPVRITIANAPVADYRFNETSGLSVVDSSGRNNGGAITGGVTRVNDGTRGRVLSFNGIDGLVTVADSASLDVSSQLTLEAWVRPTAVDTWRNVIMKERGTGLSYALYASDDNRKPSGYVRTGSVDEAVQGPSRLPGSAWSHVAMTYDGAFMRLFVNGVEVERRRETGAINVSNGKLRIGGNKNWGEYFKGQIDDVLIYGVAIGEAQIKADMNR